MTRPKKPALTTQERVELDFKKCSNPNCCNSLVNADGLLPVSEFHKGKARCKICRSEETRIYYEKNTDKFRASSKKYREEHLEKVRTRKKKYREDHPEKVRASRKKYREEHPEKVKAWKKKYREEHPEKVKASSKKYREEHPEKVRASSKKYYEEHPEEIKAWQKKYRKKHPEKVRASSKKYREKYGMGIYFIRGEKYIKIGQSMGLRKRINGLVTQNELPLRVCGILSLDSKEELDNIEMKFHDAFQDHRHHGEWFDVGIIEHIKEICPEAFDNPLVDVFNKYIEELHK